MKNMLSTLLLSLHFYTFFPQKQFFARHLFKLNICKFGHFSNSGLVKDYITLFFLQITTGKSYFTYDKYVRKLVFICVYHYTDGMIL